MRYLILRPPTPCDPRFMTFESLAELHEKIPLQVECAAEQEAEAVVHGAYPDAVAMVMPVKVGSNSVVLLGIVENVQEWAKRDPVMNEVPCVMFVEAVFDNRGEMRRGKRPTQIYDKHTWKPPTIPYGTAHHGVTQAEWRADGMANPMPFELNVGIDKNGRLVLHGLVVNETFSVLVDPDALHALLSDVRASRDGASHGEADPRQTTIEDILARASSTAH